MELYTERIEKYVNVGALDSKKRSLSQEYFVLAVLKYFYSQKFVDAIKSERPDIQGSVIGVEVTISETNEDCQADSEFAKLCNSKGNDKKIIEKIEKSGKYHIDDLYDLKSLSSGGGGNREFEEPLKHAIKKKIQSIQKYVGDYKGELGLAILQLSIPISDCDEEIVAWVHEALLDEHHMLRELYVISYRYIFFFDLINDCYEKKTVSKDVKERLSKIARMTAEGILTIKDEEWN